MADLDYLFVQDLIDFGRGMAGQMVGQPFKLYRLNAQSSGKLIDKDNVAIEEIRAKVTHSRKVNDMENEYMHTTSFTFSLDSSLVHVGDVLEQTDELGSNSFYAVSSKRPLRPVVCTRVESECFITRTHTDRQAGYSGTRTSSELPFVLDNGAYRLGEADEQATTLLCGIQSIGQKKNLKPTHLPMDTITSWWFIYVPELPGLTARLRENDIITVLARHADEPNQRYRITIPYYSPVGTSGGFYVAEKVN